MSKFVIKLMGVFMSPITAVVAGALFISWGCVVVYSKIFNKDESALEEKLEHVLEKDIENVLNLPSGTMDGKLDFMVQSSEKEPEKDEDIK